MDIGCDPEFSIYDRDGTYLYARDYINNDGEVGLGVDGHSATAELRPGMCSSPFELVGKIRLALKVDGMRQIGDFKWVAGHYANSPLGGHIHLATDVDDTIKENLDGAFMYLRDKIEDQETKDRRLSMNYGRTDHNGVRRKYYGFEGQICHRRHRLHRAGPRAGQNRNELPPRGLCKCHTGRRAQKRRYRRVDLLPALPAAIQ